MAEIGLNQLKLNIFALNLISTELGFDAILNFEMTINLPIREFLSENLMLLSFEAFNVAASA